MMKYPKVSKTYKPLYPQFVLHIYFHFSYLSKKIVVFIQSNVHVESKRAMVITRIELRVKSQKTELFDKAKIV